MRIFILSALLLIYVAVTLFLSLKLRDIIVNPAKYAHPQLVAEGDYLIATRRPVLFFKSLSHQYGMVVLPIILVLLAVQLGIIFLLHGLFLTGNTPIFFGTAYIGALASMFTDISLAYIIVISIKRPFFDVAAREAVNAKSRQDCYKRLYMASLILFVVTFPFYALAANNYCGYNQDGITYSKYFQIGARTVRYEDIDGVQIDIHQSNNGKVDCFEYILICNGDSIDINEPNTSKKFFTDEVFEVHKYIEAKGDCDAFITPLNEITQSFINGMDDREREIALYIFEGFHR